MFMFWGECFGRHQVSMIWNAIPLCLMWFILREINVQTSKSINLSMAKLKMLFWDHFMIGWQRLGASGFYHLSTHTACYSTNFYFSWSFQSHLQFHFLLYAAFFGVNIIIICCFSNCIWRFMKCWPHTNFILNGLVSLNVVNRWIQWHHFFGG